MMPLKVSSPWQTFALARSTNSLDKKTRRRRSKEERKTMVESFIKKYQTSNNGNFPSLNLTHKEVGGSFYTVREIVREIIQENKVLGPGGPNSMALNLENCFEGDAMGSFSMDPQVMDQEYNESYSLSSEHQMASKQSHDAVESETVDSLSVHLNGCAVSHPATYNHLSQNSSNSYLAPEYEKLDLTKESGEAHDNSGNHECLSSEAQSRTLKDYNDHKVLQQVHLSNYVPGIYSSSESGVNKNHTESKGSPVARTTNYPAEGDYVPESSRQDVLPETKMVTNSVNGNSSSPCQDYSVSAAGEVRPLASKSCSSDGRLAEAVDLTRSVEALETQSISNDDDVDSVEIDKSSITEGLETTDYLSSTPMSEVPGLISSVSSSSKTTKVKPEHALQLVNTDGIATNAKIINCDKTPVLEGSPDMVVRADECADFAIESDSVNRCSTTRYKQKKSIHFGLQLRHLLLLSSNFGQNSPITSRLLHNSFFFKFYSIISFVFVFLPFYRSVCFSKIQSC